MFEQPFGYTLEEVLKYAKNKEKFECSEEDIKPSETLVYYNRVLIDFWHDISKKYIPIKKEIIDETNIIMKKLFNNSTNVLGVKIRGTDYISIKPKGHPITPNIDVVISDIKNMTRKNRYDWIFFASEDESKRKNY